jgi:hypothetical protein
VARPDVLTSGGGTREDLLLLDADSLRQIPERVPSLLNQPLGPGRRLAFAAGTTVHVLALDGSGTKLSFSAEHAVKRVAAAFVGDLLGVRTDYGCASLYALG